MGARYCSYCGRPVAPNANFCASCGAPVAGAAPTPAPTGAPLTFSVPPPPPPTSYYPSYPVAPRGPSPASAALDRSALSQVYLAAILGLVGAILSVVSLFATPAFSFVSTTTTSSGTSVSLDMTGLYLVVAVGAAGFILGILELWLYREAFRTLASQDDRFSTPASLTLMALIAVFLLAAALLGLVAVVSQAIVCAGSGNAITSSCINVGAALAVLAAIAILGIVLLVGYIGFLIGVWRLGTRYSDGMFKAAAILLIIPILNVVGTILILIASHSARSRFGSVSPPPFAFR